MLLLAQGVHVKKQAMYFMQAAVAREIAYWRDKVMRPKFFKTNWTNISSIVTFSHRPA